MISDNEIVSASKHLLMTKVSKHAIFGLLIALTCILVATSLAGFFESGRINLDSMVYAQKTNFALWVLDLMPFLFAMWGQYSSSLMAKEATVVIMDQTSELRAHADAIEYKASYQATHDTLTGLPNRVLVFDRMLQAHSSARRDDRPFAVLVMDLDHFKEINDTLGHYNGDRLLKQVATRIKDSVRDIDTVGRLGGDEFAVLLPTISAPEDAEEVAKKLLKALEPQFQIHGINLDVTASIGIAVYPEHGDDVDTLMQRADVAMYATKNARTGYGQYCPSLDANSKRRLSLAGELRQSIETGGLVLHYQPKVSLRTGRIAGAEALVRWQHPEHGLMFPDEFIPLAERTGLIRPLTLWVIEHGLEDCAYWNAQGLNVGVSLNISARELIDPQLPGTFEKFLNIHAVDPSLVVLELTESAIMADPQRALDVMNRLNAMGMKMSVDDFGTGYSSLAYLKQLPVSEIKIDKSFVMDMLQDENDAVIVRATIDLGHNLSMSVVAEGVQDRATWDQLGRLGCDLMQGQFTGMPMECNELIERANQEPAQPTSVYAKG
ncbi:MAG: EAL domain-containing protein [Gammaproteobacteria bacterium]|nr:EAL domain-containing protein [Gammaproteobacteria bacterium]